MSQTETVKAVAADEPTEAVRSFVRTVKRPLLGASTPRKGRFASCWRASAARLP